MGRNVPLLLCLRSISFLPGLLRSSEYYKLVLRFVSIGKLFWFDKFLPLDSRVLVFFSRIAIVMPVDSLWCSIKFWLGGMHWSLLAMFASSNYLFFSWWMKDWSRGSFLNFTCCSLCFRFNLGMLMSSYGLLFSACYAISLFDWLLTSIFWAESSS